MLTQNDPTNSTAKPTTPPSPHTDGVSSLYLVDASLLEPDDGERGGVTCRHSAGALSRAAIAARYLNQLDYIEEDDGEEDAFQVAVRQAVSELLAGVRFVV